MAAAKRSPVPQGGGDRVSGTNQHKDDGGEVIILTPGSRKNILATSDVIELRRLCDRYHLLASPSSSKSDALAVTFSRRPDGIEQVTIQLWRQGDDGAWIPTRAGVTFDVDLVPNLLIDMAQLWWEFVR